MRSLRADGASPRTLDVYGDVSALFHNWLLERRYSTDPNLIEKQHVEEFLIWLREERQAKPATVRNRFSALRRFFNWLVEEEELERSPMERMHGPKVDEPPPEVMTEDEQRRLLDACKGSEFEDKRDLAMVSLMLDAGLRRGEAAGIMLEDLDLEGQLVKITGKGNRPGVAFFGAKTARDIDRYLRVRARHWNAESPSLWLAQKGVLTGDGVHHAFTRRAALAGLERHVWPHLTRHTWAHSLKSAGASDEDVMTLGRWRDPKIMLRYGSSAKLQRARETHKRLSPRDRLG